jgi:hypothetical protein
MRSFHTGQLRLSWSIGRGIHNWLACHSLYNSLLGNYSLMNGVCILRALATHFRLRSCATLWAAIVVGLVAVKWSTHLCWLCSWWLVAELGQLTVQWAPGWVLWLTVLWGVPFVTILRWISWPGSSEELFVKLIFDGKSWERVPSEMLISKSTEFPGSGNIAQMLIY